MKEYLDSSIEDLNSVYESLELYWTKQHADYEARLESAKTRTPIRAEQPIFALLLRKIYPYALNKLVEQLNRPEPLPLCTGTFRLSMGLPCAHDIRQRLSENGHIRLDELHDHWHISREVTGVAPVLPPQVLDPLLVRQGRGRPRGAMNRPALPPGVVIVPPPPAENGAAGADAIPPPVRNRGRSRPRGGRAEQGLRRTPNRELGNQRAARHFQVPAEGHERERPRGRARGEGGTRRARRGSGPRGTRRNPSAFEVDED